MNAQFGLDVTDAQITEPTVLYMARTADTLDLTKMQFYCVVALPSSGTDRVTYEMWSGTMTRAVSRTTPVVANDRYRFWVSDPELDFIKFEITADSKWLPHLLFPNGIMELLTPCWLEDFTFSFADDHLTIMPKMSALAKSRLMKLRLAVDTYATCSRRSGLFSLEYVQQVLDMCVEASGQLGMVTHSKESTKLVPQMFLTALRDWVHMYSSAKNDGRVCDLESIMLHGASIRAAAVPILAIAGMDRPYSRDKQ
jgi:hypothetical protein